MRPLDNIEKLIKKLRYKPSAETHDRVLGNILQALENREKQKPAATQPNIWRIIMKSKITKFAAAVLVIAALIIGFNLFKGTPAWAIEQTIEALKNIESVVLSGEIMIGGSPDKFRSWIKGDLNKPSSFRGRIEIEAYRLIGVVHDDIAYQHELGCGEIYTVDLEKIKGRGVGTTLLYEAIKNAPWVVPIAPTMFQAAKLVSSDWQEVYKKDEVTQRECVFVTGSYKPLSASFQIVFDLETKLIVRAKYWTNPNREGTPGLNIENIIYNEEISDEIFDLEKTTGAKVINEEEREKRWALWRRALELERNKQYSEAIKVHQEIYEKYPRFRQTPEALCQIAILYRDMGQYDKAIEYFEKVPREYSAPRYAILDAYRLLGLCHMTIGQDVKALEDFQTCLKLIDQWDSEGRDWQKYRQLVESHIEKIKSKK